MIGTVDPWTKTTYVNTKYYHTDHLGTTRFVVPWGESATGAVTYTAFGEKVSGSDHRYGYAGAWGYQGTLDDQTPPAAVFPFLHLGHRYYDPSSGRFLQRDPIGIEGARNVYEYIQSLPTGLVDPSGQTIWSPPSGWWPNTGIIRYGPSRPRGAPPSVRRLAFRYGTNNPHQWGWRGAGIFVTLCVASATVGAAGGRAIDNDFGRHHRGFRISDGLADIIYRRLYGGDDADYDPWGLW